jgi:hypothetical protein
MIVLGFVDPSRYRPDPRRLGRGAGSVVCIAKMPRPSWPGQGQKASAQISDAPERRSELGDLGGAEWQRKVCFGTHLAKGMRERDGSPFSARLPLSLIQGRGGSSYRRFRAPESVGRVRILQSRDKERTSVSYSAAHKCDSMQRAGPPLGGGCPPHGLGGADLLAVRGGGSEQRGASGWWGAS